MKKIIAITILLITTQNLISQTADELNSKGIEFAKKGKIDKAFETFEEAIKLFPDSPGPYSNRGNIYRIRKEYDLAINDYSKSLELYPDNFNVRYARNYQKIVTEFPNQPNLHILYNNWASLYREIENPKEALLKINQALKLKKDYDIGLFNRAGIYLELGEEKDACKDFKKALKLNLEKNEHFEADEDFEKLKQLCE